MNTDIHVLITAAPEHAAAQAERLVHRCEARWSRFRPDSELMQLNASSAPVVLSEDTYALIEAAVDAWRQTGGVFDPGLLDALVAAGYDRSFETLPPVAPVATPAPAVDTVAVARPTPADIEFFPGVHAIRRPEGLGLDLGGIAKGATADAVAADLVASGASGACVNIGGDVAVRGRGPLGDGGWLVDLACPGAEEGRAIRLAEGAVCTSTTLKRRWITTDGEEHHLRDPVTGASLRSGAVTATLIGATATQTEVLTKVILAAGVDGAADAAARFNVTGLVIDEDGRVHDLPGFDRFDVTTPRVDGGASQ